MTTVLSCKASAKSRQCPELSSILKPLNLTAFLTVYLLPYDSQFAFKYNAASWFSCDLWHQNIKSHCKLHNTISPVSPVMKRYFHNCAFHILKQEKSPEVPKSELFSFRLVPLSLTPSTWLLLSHHQTPTFKGNVQLSRDQPNVPAQSCQILRQFPQLHWFFLIPTITKSYNHPSDLHASATDNAI